MTHLSGSRRHRRAAAVLGTLLALLVSGCTLTPAQGTDRAQAAASAAPHVSGTRMRAMAQAALDRRARAVRDGDWKAFAADLDRSDPAFMRLQRRFFDNLRQLPLRRFSYRVGTDRWNPFYADRRWRRSAYIPYVRQRMQLRGFDRYPVDTVFGVTWAWHDGRWEIVSDTDVRSRTEDGSQDQPWDLTALHVVRSKHVLGIFDGGSEAHAGVVMRAARNSIAIVSHRLPVHWHRQVVVYALSGGAVLHRLGGIPGGDPDNLSAVSFPVWSQPGRRGRVAATRVLVHPDYVSSIKPRHDHLLTHEMTHAATTGVSGGGPVWADEGLAEWVATRHVDPYSWTYSRRMIERAARGVHAMPSSYTFNTVDVFWNYNLSLMACDYIADRFGPRTLWRTFLALQADWFVKTDHQQNAVLRRVLGMDSHELARHAAEHMVASSVFSGLARSS